MKQYKEKAWFYIKWFTAIVPIGILSFFLSPIFCIPALLLSFLGKWNPLWIFLDDEILYNSTNADWRNYKEHKGKFAWYHWHAFRNPAWNGKNLMAKPKKSRVNGKYNNEKYVQVLYHNLKRDGVALKIYGKWLNMAGFKWIDKNGKEGFQVHSGERVSRKYSNIGKSRYWYRAKGTLYLRHSVAEFRLLTFVTWRYPFVYRTLGTYEFKMGASEKRYLFTMRRKPSKNLIN